MQNTSKLRQLEPKTSKSEARQYCIDHLLDAVKQATIATMGSAGFAAGLLPVCDACVPFRSLWCPAVGDTWSHNVQQCTTLMSPIGISFLSLNMYCSSSMIPWFGSAYGQLGSRYGVIYALSSLLTSSYSSIAFEELQAFEESLQLSWKGLPSMQVGLGKLVCIVWLQNPQSGVLEYHTSWTFSSIGMILGNLISTSASRSGGYKIFRGVQTSRLALGVTWVEAAQFAFFSTNTHTDRVQRSL